LTPALTELTVHVEDGARYDWTQAKNVGHALFVGCDFKDQLEREAVIKCIQLLSKRTGKSDASIFHDERMPSIFRNLDRVKEIGQRILQNGDQSHLLYPGLSLLAIHACDPRPGAILHEDIAGALKDFVRDRRRANAEPLNLLLRPSPCDRDLTWFKNHGVNCVLTTGRDNER
jgi:hypothetical protein